MVMLAILRLGDGAYTVPIRGEIVKRTGRRVSRGALYTTLERLEEKGGVTSELGEPTPVRGGRPKRFWQVTPEGMAQLRHSRDAMRNMARGLTALLDRTK